MDNYLKRIDPEVGEQVVLKFEPADDGNIYDHMGLAWLKLVDMMQSRGLEFVADQFRFTITPKDYAEFINDSRQTRTPSTHEDAQSRHFQGIPVVIDKDADPELFLTNVLPIFQPDSPTIDEDKETCAMCNYCDVRKVMPEPYDSSGEVPTPILGYFCRVTRQERRVEADYWCGQHTHNRARADRAFFAAHALNSILRARIGGVTIEREVALAFEYADRMLEKSL